MYLLNDQISTSYNGYIIIIKNIFMINSYSNNNKAGLFSHIDCNEDQCVFVASIDMITPGTTSNGPNTNADTLSIIVEYCYLYGEFQKEVQCNLIDLFNHNTLEFSLENADIKYHEIQLNVIIVYQLHLVIY